MLLAARMPLPLPCESKTSRSEWMNSSCGTLGRFPWLKGCRKSSNQALLGAFVQGASEPQAALSAEPLAVAIDGARGIAVTRKPGNNGNGYVTTHQGIQHLSQ
mmetsp:Transcript_2951/g.5866  ORF Transcript_2951/g.5866 Transcript_2951/m.5866 type:complete len:103 (+) Transcript_2951:93-401(+)